MQYKQDILNAPDPELGDKEWSFIQDLRPFFPRLRRDGFEQTNHEIGRNLIRRGVIRLETDKPDCEAACTYVYFRTKKLATAFQIQRGPISVVVPPFAIVIMQPEWNRLKKFLNDTLTPKQYQALQTLDIKTQTFNI